MAETNLKIVLEDLASPNLKGLLEGVQANTKAFQKLTEEEKKAFEDGAKTVLQFNEGLKKNVTTISGLRQQQEALVKALENTKIGSAEFKKLQAESDKVKKKLGEVSGEANGMSSVFKKVGGAIVAAFAIERIIAFGKAAFDSFLEAELSARKLESAVNALGGSGGAFENLIEQSSELQKTTIFSDEAIQGAQTIALQFGIQADEVQRLIPLISDFASATGQDLSAAMETVLRGVEGQTRGLKIYGVDLVDTGDRTKNLAQITDQLTKKFSGQAEVVANTASGSFEKFKNQVDDLLEGLGEMIALPLGDLANFFSRLANGSDEFQETVKNSRLGFQQLFDEMVKRGASASEFQAVFNSINKSIDGLDLSVEESGELLKEYNKALQLFEEQINRLKNPIDESKKSHDELLRVMALETKTVGDLETKKKFLDDVLKSLTVGTKDQKIATEELKKVEEELKVVHGQETDAQKKQREKMEAATKAAEAETEALKKLRDEQRKSALEGTPVIFQLEKEREAALLQAEKDFKDLGKLKEAQEAINATFNKRILDEEAKQAEAEKELAKQAEADRQAVAQAKSDASIKNAADADDREKKRLEEKKKLVDAEIELGNRIVGFFQDQAAVEFEVSERRLNALNTSIAETQRAIQQEQSLADQGKANKLASLEDELQKQQQLRNQAIEEQEKIRKRQFILDTLTQASSLATASADIFKSLAPAGPIGVGIAIATIATMIASFIATKAQAAEAAGFKHGGYTGDVGTNTEAGVVHGQEFVHTAEKTRRHRRLFEAIHSDNFSRLTALDLAPILKGTGVTINNEIPEGMNKRYNVLRQEGATTNLDITSMSKELAAIKSNMNKFFEQYSKKPQITVLPDGSRIEKTGNITRKIRKG